MKRPSKRTGIILTVFIVSTFFYAFSFIPPSLSNSPSNDYIRILAGPLGFRESPQGAILDINMTSGSFSLTVPPYSFYNASYMGPTIFYILTPFQISNPSFNEICGTSCCNTTKTVCTGANGIWNESVTPPVSVEPNYKACYPVTPPCGGVLGTTWYVVINQTRVWNLKLQMQMSIPVDPVWKDQKLLLVFSNGFSALPQEVTASYVQRFKKAPFPYLVADILSQRFYVNVETPITPDSLSPLPLVVRGDEYTWNVTYPSSLWLPGNSKGQTIQVSILNGTTKTVKPIFNSLGAVALGSILGLVFEAIYSTKNPEKDSSVEENKPVAGGKKHSPSTLALTLISLAVLVNWLLSTSSTSSQFVLLVLIALVSYGLIMLVEPWLRASLSTGMMAKMRAWFPLNRMLRMTVIIFGVLLMALAYVATAGATYTGYPVGTIAVTLITIEGLLLGLLSVSVFSGRGASSTRTGYLAILTFLSILFSLATIMLAQLSAAAWVLPAFFTVDVGMFIVVAGAYSWLLIETNYKP